MWCKHKYKVISEKLVARWANDVDEYSTLITCENCGKTKYIRNTISFERAMFIGTLTIGTIGIIVALIFKP